MTFQRIAREIEKTWAAYPLIGIIALFAVLGYSVYQGYKAKDYAKTAASISSDNSDLIKKNLKSKDDLIAEKDHQISQKDSDIQTQTNVIGQLYNDALALQQQVIVLGGKPKPIPVTLPSKTSVAPAKTSASSVQTSSTTIVTTTATPSECKLGLSAAPLNIIGVNLCIPPPPKG
jgi:hypothetical protein